MKTDLVAVGLTALSGIGTLAGLVLFRDQIPVARDAARVAGFIVLYAGMAVVVWAGLHLKSGIGGFVAPRSETLITTGPFRFVRHPTYLAMVIALIGVSIVTRSWIGLGMAALVFLPTEVHRARREERALREKFGDTWEDYAARTGFFLPRLGAGRR